MIIMHKMELYVVVIGIDINMTDTNKEKAPFLEL